MHMDADILHYIWLFNWCQHRWFESSLFFSEPSVIFHRWLATAREREREKERGKSWLAGTAANAMGCSTIPRTYYSYYYFHLLQWFNFISSIMRLTDYPPPQHRDTGFKQPRALIPQREQGRVRGKEGRSERMGEKGTCVCRRSHKEMG